ncbi:MAG: hypothetical protein JRJ65_18610, partial [Deltaproteobacteria bacterium]|nr:hypothetical protein [Deltaproteobacteria bacterium]
MKRRILIILVIMAVVAGFTIGPAKAVDWPKIMVSVSGGHSSPGHIIPIAWTPKHQKDEGVTWRVVGAASTAERINWLKTGKAHYYYREWHSLAMDIEVGDGYEQDKSGQTRLRISIQGFPQWFGAAALADQGIKTITDIKPGTTFVVPVAATTLVHFYHAFRRYLDMSEKELVMVGHASFPGAYRAFGLGQAKLVNTSPDGSTALRWKEGRHGLNFMNWPEDPEAEKRFAEYLPDVPFGIVKRGPKEFQGLRMPVNYWSATSLASLDAEVVYNVAKWMDQNYDNLKDLTVECPDMTMANLRDALDYAYCGVHDGLIRYLKEKGLWTAADDNRQKYNVWLNDSYIKLYSAAMKEAKAKGWQIAPD